jgi:hypothetical protein
MNDLDLSEFEEKPALKSPRGQAKPAAIAQAKGNAKADDLPEKINLADLGTNVILLLVLFCCCCCCCCCCCWLLLLLVVGILVFLFVFSDFYA